MKIAIHHRENSFSERWIEYCETENIPYKVVNCFDTDIIEQLSDCSALMWHYHHASFKDRLLAQKVLFAVEHSGKITFPNFKTSWHFDDKVGQKYLLEALEIPLVPSFVFYSKKDALDWVKRITFPKVFKLRGGAGATNVKLVKSKHQAEYLIKKAFRSGFSQFNNKAHFLDIWEKFKSGAKTFDDLFRAGGRLIISPKFSRLSGKERGYIYFQDYLDNEGFDIRAVVIDRKVVVLRRLVRDDDFRASGSGKLIFNNEKEDKRIIKMSLDIASSLEAQSLAIDFIITKNSQKVFVVEISYGFPMLNFLEGSAGYWDEDLEWIPGNFNVQNWMVDLVRKQLSKP